MSQAFDRNDSASTGQDNDNSVLLGAAGWLSLAAAPTFVLMAWLTGALGGGKLSMICATGPEPAWLGGMIPMYLLMGAFHSGPWLRLFDHRRNRGGR